LAGLVAVVMAMVASAMHLWPQARANAVAMRALAQVREWQAPRAKPPAVQAWLQARAELAQALAMAPHNADLHEAMAYLYLSSAQRPETGPLVQGIYLRQALAHLQWAIVQRPMVPSAWANLALALHQLLQLEPARAASELPLMWAAFDRAMAYGQRERGVQQGLASMALAHWASLDPARRQAVLSMVAEATPAQQRALQALARRQQIELGPL
jgi:tetratricopeptide (TPR) repeat protein